MLTVFLIIVIPVVLFHAFLTISSLIHHKRKLKRAFTGPATYHPQVGVFVPCKGTAPCQEANLRSVAEQDYKDFTITFITESIEDEATPVIQKIVAAYPHAHHVVAGLAKSCCQKNQNLLAGLSIDKKSEVLVFCDSDIEHDSDWLENLVQPLAKDDMHVSFGFRWVVSLNKSFSVFLHSYLNAYIFMLLKLPFSNGAWGGATAIRRDTFEKLNVAKHWQTSIVDDISLMRIIKDNNMKSVFVPDCLSNAHNSCTSIPELIRWFSRQILYLKFYDRPMWTVILISHFLTAVILLSGPGLLIASFFFKSFLNPGIICLIFGLFLMINYTLLRIRNYYREHSLKWFLVAPLVQLIAITSILKTLFVNSMNWHGIIYEVDRKGKVIKIVRKEHPKPVTVEDDAVFTEIEFGENT